MRIRIQDGFQRTEAAHKCRTKSGLGLTHEAAAENWQIGKIPERHVLCIRSPLKIANIGRQTGEILALPRIAVVVGRFEIGPLYVKDRARGGK